MSSVFFDAILNSSRPYLKELSIALAREIFDPIDEAGLFVVGLTEMPPDEFNIIFIALRRGYDFCEEKGSCGILDQSFFVPIMGLWKEILVAMEEDERK